MAEIVVQDRLLFPDILWARPQNIHKRQAGKILVIAGSRSMAGAALLTAEAAFRAGVGLVVLGYPKGLQKSYQPVLLEAMSLVLPETPSGSIAKAALLEIQKASTDVDVVVLGPGLSRNTETQLLVIELIRTLAPPLVVDADGLNAVADTKMDPAKLFKGRKPTTVLTPHVGEFARLTQLSAQEIENKRLQFAPSYAAEWGVILVLKGHGTVIAQSEREVVLNKSGTPALATAGTGDVLSGMIGALVAQNLAKPFEATATAVYVHGKSGEEAQNLLGERSVMATDVIKAIPKVLKELEK